MSIPASASDQEGESLHGMVAGRVTAGGHPVQEATVMIVEGHASHPDIAALTDESGGYQLGGLTPGWYNLEASDGQRRARRSVELLAGQHATLDFSIA